MKASYTFDREGFTALENDLTQLRRDAFVNDEIASGIAAALINVVIHGLVQLWFYHKALEKRGK